MLPVISLTLNPCIDLSAHIPELKPDKKLHCHTLKKEPGGGGINISRVIQRFGGSTIAVYPAGGYTGDYFNKMLDHENVRSVRIHIKDFTRENIVVKEDCSNLQYRFGMPGPVMQQDEWEKILFELSSIEEMGFLVASGSLADGIPKDFFARVGEIAKQKNVKYILDTSGESLKPALANGVYMIKPNLGELAMLAGVKELNKTTATLAAREIISNKQAEVVVVSMGASGALLVTASIAEQIVAPAVKIKSTVGAGDSMVAGIVLALSEQKHITEAVQFGVACGTAATMNEGTGLCSKEDAMQLFKLITG
ncbi:MAG: 1-phosphofructokinase family hexose kinase [Ferruginibacter sp.]